MAWCDNEHKISAYHDGELPADEAEGLRQHLVCCPACRHELERLEAMSAWLAAAGVPAATPEVMRRLRGSMQPGRDRAVLRVAGALTAAAAAVLILSSAMLWSRQAGTVWPAGPTEAWQRAAVSTPASQPALAGLDEAESSPADVDVRIAESILEGYALFEEGYEHE